MQVLDRYNTKPKISIVKLEDFVCSKGYSFTINPKEQFDSVKQLLTKTRMKRVILHIKKLLSDSCLEYKLHPEISPSGRIHAHGWIWINNPLEFFDSVLPMLADAASLEIDELTKDDTWEIYCVKQSHICGSAFYKFHSQGNFRT